MTTTDLRRHTSRPLLQRDPGAALDLPPSFAPQRSWASDDDDDRDSWRTSTAPAAVSMALLTGLGVGVILGLRGMIDLVGSFLVAG